MPPTYIYTPEGVFKVPPLYLVQDTATPIRVSEWSWGHIQKYHAKFTGHGFLKNRPIRADQIVVLGSGSPMVFSGRYRICHWFVRIAFEISHRNQHGVYGANFLWQLPHDFCTKIIKELRLWRAAHNTPPIHFQSLISNMLPTRGDFQADEWPGLINVDRFTSPSNTIFVMCVKPCKFTVEEHDRSQKDRLVRIGRPWGAHAFHASKVNFSHLPQDTCKHIFEIAAHQWIKSPLLCDWNALLTLRKTCRDAKEVIDKTAEDVMKNVHSSVKTALDGVMEYIVVARDLLLDMGLPVIPFLLDSADPDFFTLARVRTNKRPRTLPPPRPPSIEERKRKTAEVLARTIATLQQQEEQDRLKSERAATEQ